MDRSRKISSKRKKKLATLLEKQHRFAEAYSLRERIFDTPEKQAELARNPEVSQDFFWRMQGQWQEFFQNFPVRAGVLSAADATRFIDAFSSLVRANSQAQQQERQGQIREAVTHYLLVLDASEQLRIVTRDLRTVTRDAEVEEDSRHPL